MTPQQRAAWVRFMGARSDWWALSPEPVVEPEWKVVDTHCHFWDEREMPDPADPGRSLRTSRYMPEEFVRDAAGHKVSDIVYVECGSGYSPNGPAHLRPVGETGFAVGLSQRLNGRNGTPNLAAIAAYADLRSPDLDAILDAHADAGEGKVRATRHSGARLDDPSARLLAGAAAPGLYADTGFRRGVAHLGGRGLLFEAFQFHFQLEALADLVSATPGTTFVVNHLGAPIGYGRGRDADQAVFAAWIKGMEAIARHPNVILKLGGIASPVTEYDAPLRENPPSSADFVADRGAYFHSAIRLFGPERCMFESNFPVDSVSLSYRSLWNAYKTIAAEYPEAGRNALLSETACRTYGIPLISQPTSPELRAPNALNKE